ncbi:MAG: hypothetical protein CVV27_03865 [Candidatus Melainabacteria bacterium HGW-Melainabacteria-1]|nr:MAG: hypothetical protein CVV27_03865 [Candidatus Melainabacteria bacterium HGW-Melainabacteria-1]
MAVFQQVLKEIDCRPPGELLTLADFALPPEQFMALAKALSRLTQAGTLRRVMKGLYFKPMRSVIGEVTTPSYEKVLQKLLELYRDKISYVTGTQVYSRMGLTTQIAGEFVIATDRPREPIQIGPTKVRFIRSHVTEPVDDVVLVQLLDAIWEIKQIPATTPAKAAGILLGQLRRLTNAQRQELARLALSYPPQARALTGLMLETLGEEASAKTLKASLNPLTTYQLTLNDAVFPTARSWRFQ